MATGLASLAGVARTPREPEPDGGRPRQRRVCRDPLRVLQEDALVPAELLAELPVVVVPRELLRTAALVLLPRDAGVGGTRGAVAATRLLHEAQTPRRATSSRMAVAPHGAARARAVAVLCGCTAASSCGLLRHLTKPGGQLTLVILLAPRLREVRVHQRGLDQALVCQHAAAVATRTADIREHLVEELLREPARDALARREVTRGALFAANLSGCRRSRRGRSGRRRWGRPMCRRGRRLCCGRSWRRGRRRGRAATPAEALKITRPPSLGTHRARSALSVCHGLARGVVHHGRTSGTTAAPKLRHRRRHGTGLWCRCRRSGGRLRCRRRSRRSSRFRGRHRHRRRRCKSRLRRRCRRSRRRFRCWLWRCSRR
mmetsp:Transcript_35114/g.113675  ORF Transcript_35114/g.113675 Transcript_35114/m.113675 type:complete len:373 (-) Transcript_35114:323-1441(-)